MKSSLNNEKVCTGWERVVLVVDKSNKHRTFTHETPFVSRVKPRVNVELFLNTSIVSCNLPKMSLASLLT